MLGRRRSGTGVANAHQVVKASSRQQESQTPTLWFGEVTRVYRQTDKESSSWGRQSGMHISLLENCRLRHSVLFQRILAVPDLQCAWLLLLFCAATRANYFLRVVQPVWSEQFASAHDENWNCTKELLDIEGTVRARQLSSLPLALGGLFAERHPVSVNNIPTLRMLLELPCSEGDSLRIAVSKPQQCAENDFWMWGSTPQSGGMWPEVRGQEGHRRTETPLNPVLGGNVWPAKTLRRPTFTVLCGRSSLKQTEHSGPSVVHLQVFRTLAHQRWSSHVWNLRFSGFCCFVAFGVPFLSLLTPAGAAVPLTFVATTGQLVGGQGCWGVEGSLWRAQQPASAERQGGAFQSTYVSQTSTSFRQD